MTTDYLVRVNAHGCAYRVATLTDTQARTVRGWKQQLPALTLIPLDQATDFECVEAERSI